MVGVLGVNRSVVGRTGRGKVCAVPSGIRISKIAIRNKNVKFLNYERTRPVLRLALSILSLLASGFWLLAPVTVAEAAWTNAAEPLGAGAGLSTSSIQWGDYDNDGDLDLVVSGWNVALTPRLIVYRNNGGGSFSSASEPMGAGAGVRGSSVQWGDYDRDGDLDFAAAGNDDVNPRLIIFRNNGSDSFTNVAEPKGANAGFNTATLDWGDYDNDGDLDLAVAGHDGTNYRLIVYRNNGGGSFSNVCEPRGVNLGVESSSVQWGDYDTDGDLDLLVSGYESATTNKRLIVYRNIGGDTFTNGAEPMGVNAGVGWSSVQWGDYDNDGDLDIAATGEDGVNYRLIIWRNNGGDSFTNVAEPFGANLGFYNSSIAWGDYDNDGDIDLAVSGDTASGGDKRLIIFRNDANGAVNIRPNAPALNYPKGDTITLGDTITFRWTAVTGDTTCTAAMTYNLRIGSTTANCNYFAADTNDADSSGNAVLGNVQNDTWARLDTALPVGTYYWSVQAVDQGMMRSTWATAETFAITAPPAYSGPDWYVNDTSTSGDSWTSAIGSDTNDGSASAPFRTIIKALNSAESGETIYIDKGIFDSYVVVSATETAGIRIDTNSITLIGKDSASTIIDPPGAKTVTGLYGIYADTQTGLRIQNIGVTGAYDGIKFVNVDASTISGDSACSNGEYGILLMNGSDSNTVSTSITGFNSSIGILVTGSNYNALDNVIADSNSNAGVNFSSSSYDTVMNSTMNSNGFTGLDLNGGSNYVITGNKANQNSSYGFYLEAGTNNNSVKNNTADSNASGGYYLTGGADTNTLSFDTAIGSGDGIKIVNSRNNTIAACVVRLSTWNGIVLSGARDNILETNLCRSNSMEGILLADTSNFNTLRNNVSETNTWSGIKIAGGSYDTVTGNTARWNAIYGIWLDDTATNNVVRNNTVSSNANIGIYLSDGSDTNTVDSNTANSNSDGIKLQASHGNLVVSNTADFDTYDGIVLSMANRNLVETNTCRSNLQVGILVADGSQYNLVRNNTADTNTQVGIKMLNSSYDTVTANTVRGNLLQGILLDGSDTNTIDSNTCDVNGDGIKLSASHGNTVRSNEAKSDTYNGIVLSASGNNVLESNVLQFNLEIGIQLADTSNANTVRYNLIHQNTQTGLRFWVSDSNVVTQNDISGNDTGVLFSGASIGNVVTKNYLSGNIVNDVYNAAGLAQTLTRNWFGSADSAAIKVKVSDTASVWTPWRLAVIDTGAGADTTAPAAPDTVAVVGAPSDTSIIIEWSAVSTLEEVNGGSAGVAGYRVYRSAVKDTSSWTQVAQVSSSTIRYQDTSVALLTNYYYRVTAFDTATFVNESFYSDSQPYDSAQMQSTVNWYVNDTSTSGDSFTTAVGSDVTGNGSPANPWRSLVKAMQLATAGDTIFIDAGLYDSFVTVNGTETVGVNIDKDSITLIGKDSTSTVIDPPGANTLISLYGIYADTQVGLRITNLGVKDAYNGIYFINVDRSTISNDSAGICGYAGIYLSNGSDTNTVSGNRTDSNAVWGIALNSSSNNTVNNNTVNLNSQYGIELAASSNGNTVSNNTASSNTNYGISLNSSSNNTVSNNTVSSNVLAGIRLASSSNNTVVQNDVRNNTEYQISIALASSSDTVQKNNIVPSGTNPDSGVYNGSTSATNKFTFTRNWWNSTDTARIKQMIFQASNGDSVIWQPFRLGQVDTDAGADTTAPKAPDTVAVLGPSDTIITIAWGESTTQEDSNGGAVGLAGYRIYRSLVKDTSSWLKVADVSSVTTQWTDTAVTLGVNYFYRVTAYDTASPYLNESFYSDSQPFDSAQAVSQVNWYVNDTSISGDVYTGAVGSDTIGLGTISFPFRSIPMAMRFATAGDTIYIDAGLYDSFVRIGATETAGVNITVDSITLVGKDSASTIIDPPGAKTLSGLYGIYADTQVGLRIQNIGVTGAYHGIKLVNVDSSTLTGDSASSNGGYGIFLENGSSGNTLTSNAGSGNTSNGIYLTSSSNNTLTSNTTSGNSSSGVALFASSNNTLISNTSSGNSTYGIYLTSSSNNTLTSNVSSGNSNVGIYLYSSNSNTLTSNRSSGNLSYGFHIDASVSNTLASNTASGNSGVGIYLLASSYNNLTSNTSRNNGTAGFGLTDDGGGSGSSFNVFRQNTADSNAGWGFLIDDGGTPTSTGDTFSKNIGITSPYAAYIDSGVRNATGSRFDFTRNYWMRGGVGTTDSTVIRGMIKGIGADSIAFTPFRLGAVDTTPGADTSAPKAPDTVAIIGAPSDTTIKIEWAAVTLGDEGTAGQGDLGGYRVYRSAVKDTSLWLQVAQVTAPTAQWTDTSVVLGQVYYYRVTAYDTASPYINESFYSDSQPSDTAMAASQVNWYVNDGSIVGDVFAGTTGSDTGGNGSQAFPFRTITKALQFATPGDTVLVDAGLYTETVVINTDNITLIGKDSASTVIDPPGLAAGIYGVYAAARTALVVKNLGVAGADYGIYWSAVTSSRIENDSAGACLSDGIYLEDSDSNTVSNNIANLNSANGITLSYCTGNTVSGNTANSNATNGVNLVGSVNNTVNGNSANSNSSRGIILTTGSTGNRVFSNRTTANAYGISLGLNSTGNLVAHNAANSNTTNGIYVQAANNVVTQNDVMLNTQYQIYLTSAATGAVVEKNNIQPSGGADSGAYVQAPSTGLQTFTRNWWGTANEAAINNRIFQTANADSVLWRPYRLGVVDTAAGADTTAPGVVSLSLDTGVLLKITLTWAVPTLNEETNGVAVGFGGLNIYRLVDAPDTSHWANPANLVKQTAASDTTWTDTNVAVAKTYYYRATSLDSAVFPNESFFSDTKWTMPTEPAGVLDALILGETAPALDVEPGDSVTLRVTDTGVNANPSLAETLTVRVTNLASSEQETVTLAEKDTDDAVFEAVFRFSGNAADSGSGSGRMSAQAGETVQFDYTDPANPTDTERLTLKVGAALELIARQVADTQIRQGETAAVLAFSILNGKPNDNASPTDTATAVQVTRLLGADTHLAGTGFRLWLDNGAKGVFEPAIDTLLDSASATGTGVVTLSIPPAYQAFNPGDTRDFLVSFRAADSAPAGEQLDAKVAAGGVAHVLGGQVPDTDINSAGALTIKGKPSAFVLIAYDSILTPATYDGAAGDTVPGATIMVVIRYDNDGADTAKNMFLSAKIPANSTLAEADTTLVTPHTGATATVTIRDDTGNIVAVNDPAASVVEWTFSTGCGPDNGDTFGVVDAAAADVDAGFVKVKLYIK